MDVVQNDTIVEDEKDPASEPENGNGKGKGKGKGKWKGKEKGKGKGKGVDGRMVEKVPQKV